MNHAVDLKMSILHTEKYSAVQKFWIELEQCRKICIFSPTSFLFSRSMNTDWERSGPFIVKSVVSHPSCNGSC